MLNNLGVSLNHAVRVSPRVQLPNKTCENYAQMACRHSAADPASLEDLLGRGKLENRLSFQDAAKLPGNSTQAKRKSEPARLKLKVMITTTFT